MFCEIHNVNYGFVCRKCYDERNNKMSEIDMRKNGINFLKMQLVDLRVRVKSKSKTKFELRNIQDNIDTVEAMILFLDKYFK